jgi:hypothetical protein
MRKQLLLTFDAPNPHSLCNTVPWNYDRQGFAKNVGCRKWGHALIAAYEQSRCSLVDFIEGILCRRVRITLFDLEEPAAGVSKSGVLELGVSKNLLCCSWLNPLVRYLRKANATTDKD